MGYGAEDLKNLWLRRAGQRPPSENEPRFGIGWKMIIWQQYGACEAGTTTAQLTMLASAEDSPFLHV